MSDRNNCNCNSCNRNNCTCSNCNRNNCNHNKGNRNKQLLQRQSLKCNASRNDSPEIVCLVCKQNYSHLLKQHLEHLLIQREPDGGNQLRILVSSLSCSLHS